MLLGKVILEREWTETENRGKGRGKEERD